MSLVFLAEGQTYRVWVEVREGGELQAWQTIRRFVEKASAPGADWEKELASVTQHTVHIEAGAEAVSWI